MCSETVRKKYQNKLLLHIFDSIILSNVRKLDNLILCAGEKLTLPQNRRLLRQRVGRKNYKLRFLLYISEIKAVCPLGRKKEASSIRKAPMVKQVKGGCQKIWEHLQQTL